jgi:dTDP-4-amino-4,6-dideoxygalactose transaminase
MHELSALVGLHGLEAFDAEVARRGEIAARYRERLAGVPHVQPLAAQPGVRQNHCYFAVLADDADGLRARLDRAGIESRRYFPLLATTAEAAALPRARAAAERLLCLPIHGDMSDADAERVCDAIAG